MTEVTDIDKGYLAGFIDGEGCLTATNSGPVLIIANTNLTILRKIKNLWQVGAIKRRKIKSKKWQKHFQKSKASYYYRICGKELENLLKVLHPYLIIKKEQAELLLDYCKTISKYSRGRGYLTQEALNKRKQIKRKLKILNKRGRDQQLDIFELDLDDSERDDQLKLSLEEA